MNRGSKQAAPVAIGDLPRVAEIERELGWFFTMADAEMAPASNFETTLARIDPECTVRTDEDRVVATRKHSKILARLRSMTSADAGILQAAYEPAAWPTRLSDELGALTGIVVRLACAEIGLPEDRGALKDMERTVAKELDRTCKARGFKAITRLRVQAQQYLNVAHQAYAEARARDQRERQAKREAREPSASNPPSSPRGNAERVAAVAGLPVRGFYKITELARALGMSRWRLALLLQKAGIDRYAPGKVGLVPLHELETKARPLWEGVMSAEKLRQVARATVAVDRSSSTSPKSD
jgi:hypothetical protein